MLQGPIPNKYITAYELPTSRGFTGRTTGLRALTVPARAFDADVVAILVATTVQPKKSQAAVSSCSTTELNRHTPHVDVDLC